jgi:hypothetical protein
MSHYPGSTNVRFGEFAFDQDAEDLFRRGPGMTIPPTPFKRSLLSLSHSPSDNRVRRFFPGFYRFPFTWE